MAIQRKHNRMRSDIRDRDDAFILEIDLPGFQKEEIKAYVQDGYLNVSAVRQEEKKEGRIIRQERFRGTYSRSYYIGKEIPQEEIKAAYQNGVLKLTIPKEPQKKEPVVHSIDIV